MSRAVSFILFISILIVVLGAPVSAHWNARMGHKMHFPQFPDDGDVYASGDFFLADDWQCSQTGPVKDIHFWGAWMNDNPGTITRFELQIYDDVPAGTGDIRHSRPGNLLWSETILPEDYSVDGPIIHGDWGTQVWYDPGANLCDDFDQVGFWQYNVFLPQNSWFQQTEGEIYWLAIKTVVAEGDRYWGWRTAENHWNDDAVWYDDQYGMWIDMAECVPGSGEGFPYVLGDLNDDGLTDALDLQYYTNWWYQGGPPPIYEYPPGSGFYPAADVDGDCANTEADINRLQQYIFDQIPMQYCDPYIPNISLDLSFVINDHEPGDITPMLPTLTEYGAAVLLVLLIGSGILVMLRRRHIRLQ